MSKKFLLTGVMRMITIIIIVIVTIVVLLSFSFTRPVNAQLNFNPNCATKTDLQTAINIIKSDIETKRR